MGRIGQTGVLSTPRHATSTYKSVRVIIQVHVLGRHGPPGVFGSTLRRSVSTLGCYKHWVRGVYFSATVTFSTDPTPPTGRVPYPHIPVCFTRTNFPLVSELGDLEVFHTCSLYRGSTLQFGLMHPFFIVSYHGGPIEATYGQIKSYEMFLIRAPGGVL